jgi:hypothetical protein
MRLLAWRFTRLTLRLISTQIAKAEEEARKKRAAALAEAEAAAKKKLADEAQALAKAHAEAAAKEKAAAEKRKAEEEKVCGTESDVTGRACLTGPLPRRHAKKPKKRPASAPPRLLKLKRKPRLLPKRAPRKRYPSRVRIVEVPFASARSECPSHRRRPRRRRRA